MKFLLAVSILCVMSIASAGAAGDMTSGGICLPRHEMERVLMNDGYSRRFTGKSDDDEGSPVALWESFTRSWVLLTYSGRTYDEVCVVLTGWDSVFRGRLGSTKEN